MRMILAVIVLLVIGVGPHWQKYKDEKIAAYQAKHGGDEASDTTSCATPTFAPHLRGFFIAKTLKRRYARWCWWPHFGEDGHQQVIDYASGSLGAFSMLAHQQT